MGKLLNPPCHTQLPGCRRGPHTLLLPCWFSGRRWDRPGSRGRGAWGPWTGSWAGFTVLGIRLPGGQSKGTWGCQERSPARRAAPVQSGGLRGGVGASLPPAEGPECPARGHTLLFTGSWPDTAGLQAGRVESIRVLLGRGRSLGGRTCAHAAGKGLLLPGPPRPPSCWRASPGAPHLPPSPPCRRPQPPARTPRLLIGPGLPVVIVRSLGAGLRNVIER